MTRTPVNIPASIRARLLNLAHERGDDFQLVLQRYAAERFLYRLGVSSYREQLVLKGAMLFALWDRTPYRATRDLDFTGYVADNERTIASIVKKICEIPCSEDGIIFLPDTIRSEPIRHEGEYHGFRIRVQSQVDGARAQLQIDVGLGNAIEPPQQEHEYPVLLDAPAPTVMAYPVEAVVAEKLHAIVVLGEANSRLKDFYDLYVLAQTFDFVGTGLSEAISATFSRRTTAIPDSLPVGLAPSFFADPDRSLKWRSYLARNGLPNAPADFQIVGECIRTTLWEWTRVATNDSSSTRKEVSGTKKSVVGPHKRPRFSRYRESLLDQIGDVPEHWVTMKAAWLFSIGSGTTPRSDDLSYYDGDTPWVTTSELRETVITSTEKTVSSKALETYTALKLYSRGSVVVAMYGATIGRVGVLGVPATVNQACCVFSPSEAVDTWFWFYWLQMRRAYLVSLGYGGGQPNLSQELCRSMWVPVPPLEEQRAIASFLDRETAKIDELVAKKERLIELLEEKRTALLNHVVTKGLDPDVPMRDSGVEWLGELPAHWDVKHLMHLTDASRKIMYGIVLPGPNVPEGVPIVKGGDVSADRLSRDQLSRTSFEIESAHKRSRLRQGDLVFAIRGSIGEVAIVPKELEGANLTQDAARISPARAVCGTWLLYALKSRVVFADLEAGALGATIRGINIRDLKRAMIPVPSPGEQELIAEFLKDLEDKIDSLIERVGMGIAALREFRDALVSCAVTGKIDVREDVA